MMAATLKYHISDLVVITFFFTIIWSTISCIACRLRFLIAKKRRGHVVIHCDANLPSYHLSSGDGNLEGYIDIA